MLASDLQIVLPELLLAGYAMCALLYGVSFGKDAVSSRLTWSTSAGMLLLCVWIWFSPEAGREAFGGAFVDDSFSRFAKSLVLLTGSAILLMSDRHLSRHGAMRFEFPILIAFATLGMMMMVSAGDLMALYMGLELQSLSLYVIASFRRNSIRSTEAGLKYFVLGALSSGLLLYGASLTYGYAGTTLFSGILEASSSGPGFPLGLLLGLVFVCAGLAFKVSAAPFHMWTPDVYEGAPSSVTAFFATAPKVAAVCLFARVLFDAYGAPGMNWGQIIAFLSVASMFVGSIAAIGQTNIKRLMAYSSIAHMGFVLIGLAAGTESGVQSMLVYLSIYVVMNLGVFAFVMFMERDGLPCAEVSALNQYARSSPLKALALLLLMFSLAGIPPLAGFFAKVSVLFAAVEAGMAWLAVCGVVASVIGAFYYLRIVYYMYFGSEGFTLESSMPASAWIVMMASAFAVAAGVMNLFGVESFAASAARALAG